MVEAGVSSEEAAGASVVLSGVLGLEDDDELSVPFDPSLPLVPSVLLDPFVAGELE